MNGTDGCVRVKVRSRPWRGWRRVPLRSRRTDARRGADEHGPRTEAGVRVRQRRGCRHAPVTLLVIIIAVQWPAIVARSCQGRRNGGVMLEPLGSSPPTDIKEDEEHDRRCGQTNDEKDAGDCALVPEESMREVLVSLAPYERR